MNVLTRRLLRSIKEKKGQVFSIVTVVMVGIIVYISMTASYYNLKEAQEHFYTDNHMADYYFQVVKAPEQLLKDIENLPGVYQVTGRITLDAPIIRGEDRASARIVTYLTPVNEQLNSLHLYSGRLFEESSTAGIEALVDPDFFAANNLEWNDTVCIAHLGQAFYLSIVGTASSPDYIYPIKDASMIIPDPINFGIFMLPQNQAQQAFDMVGQINQVLLKFTPGSDHNLTVEAVKQILEPYGLLSSYPCDDQLSHSILEMELTQLRSVSYYLPFVFLLLAAAIQFIIIRRMIFTQRPQIGILKALGYSNRQIVIYYASFAIIIGLVGAILGTVFGLLLCGIMTQAYAMYFNLPTYTASYNLSTISYGFLLSLSVALAAGWLAARKVTAIHPAEAMRPELPQAKGKSSNGLLLSRFRLPLEWKMSIRSISRNRGRFALTMVGVTFSVGLLIIAFSFNDMIDNMMNDYFYNSQSYDLLVRFDKVLREHDLTAVEQIDGVLKVEPFIEIQVRIHYQGRKEEDILVGYGRNMTLKTIKINNQSTSIIPEDGIVLAERTAKKLGVSIGDVVEVETLMLVGPPYRETIRVIGESEQMIGGLSYINLLRANQIFSERSLVSGAMLQVERGKTEEVEQQLNEMLTISAIISPDKEIKTFEDNLGAVVYAVSIMVIFAFILGFAIVFNTSLMNFLERKRELASLKVMGFSRKELSRLLLNESIIQSGLGILLGLPFGKILAHYYIASVETDMYSFQAAVYPLTYFYAAASATVFVLIAHRLAVRDLKNINLVEALKNKD